MTGPVDPYAVPDEHAARFVRIQEMIDAQRAPNPPRYLVMLTRYYIEGEPYGASSILVSPGTTPDLVQTQTGFTCRPSFPPHLLTEHSRRGRKPVRGGIQVHLEVRLEDIFDLLVVG